MSTAVVVGLIYADFGGGLLDAGPAPAHAAGAPAARPQAARGVGALGRIEPRSELIVNGGVIPGQRGGVKQASSAWRR